MRKLLLLFLLASGLSSMSFTSRDEGEVIYVDWTHVAESRTHYEITYRLLKCGGVNQVHLVLFNESEAQKATFSLELVNESTKETTIKEVSFEMAKLKMYRAYCDGDPKLDGLRINLPEGYDPKNTSVKVIFK
jgi:hypothetical protein